MVQGWGCTRLAQTDGEMEVRPAAISGRRAKRLASLEFVAQIHGQCGSIEVVVGVVDVRVVLALQDGASVAGALKADNGCSFDGDSQMCGRLAAGQIHINALVGTVRCHVGEHVAALAHVPDIGGISANDGEAKPFWWKHGLGCRADADEGFALQAAMDAA